MSFASALFIHVVSCKSSSLLFIARKYSILGIHSLFIHSSVEHLDCSQLLPISNKATVNIHVQALYTHVLSFLLQKYRGVEWQDCKYRVCFAVKARLLSKVPVATSHFCVPTVLCSAAQSCPTLCDPMDRSPPASSVLGIFQTRILE